MYDLRFTDDAEADMFRLQKSGDIKAFDRLILLLEEIRIHPKKGIGRPKRLKHLPGNQWGRRITRKHRLVYEIFENTISIEIQQAWGHYDDK